MAVDRKMFRSDVWEHFGWHRKAIGSSWVVCNRCCAWVSRKGNNTSNMRHHLKSVHAWCCWCHRKQHNVSPFWSSGLICYSVINDIICRVSQ